MNNKPYIVAIGVIITVATVLVMASGPGKRASPKPGNSWTLTFSIPASNNTAAFQTEIHH